MVHHKGESAVSMKKKAILIILFLMIMGTPTLATNATQPNATFVLAGWDYPDEYGQGIHALEIFENSTGSWVKVDGTYYYDESVDLEWNASVGIKIKCWTYFNNTLVGASDTNDGKNYQRHNVTVTNFGVTVFNQQNFTYSNAYPEGDPMWYYVYEVILDFLPVAGEIYTAVISYEIFYEVEA